MAFLYVTEYQRLAPVEGGSGIIPLEPAVAEQAITVSGTSAQSAAMNAATAVVRLHSDTTCSVTFGATTATATHRRMVAGVTEFCGVPPGRSFKVAVVSNT